MNTVDEADALAAYLSGQEDFYQEEIMSSVMRVDLGRVLDKVDDLNRRQMITLQALLEKLVKVHLAPFGINIQFRQDMATEDLRRHLHSLVPMAVLCQRSLEMIVRVETASEKWNKLLQDVSEFVTVEETAGIAFRVPSEQEDPEGKIIRRLDKWMEEN